MRGAYLRLPYHELMLARLRRLGKQRVHVERAEPRSEARPQLRQAHKVLLQLAQLGLREVVPRVGSEEGVYVGAHRADAFEHFIVLLYGAVESADSLAHERCRFA